MKVLVVEDDPGIADVLEYSLGGAGFEVARTSSGKDAVRMAGNSDFVVLDIGLPGMDGFDVCREIRKSSSVPVLFLTSRTEEIDRVVGLELGADDYLAKPFSPRELVARIKAILRRSGGRQAAPQTGLALDRESFTASLDGRPVELSRTEFDLLALLAGQPGRVFTREQILDGAWADGGCVTDRTVDAHIKSLRKKLLPSELIETVRGVGYRFRK
jgi:DNA-binding response OmpR family regulator